MIAGVRLAPVEDDQWEIVGWLWECFRHDLAASANAFPRPDGRYRHEWLEEYPRPDGAGYLAWAPHPDTGDPAPVGFALVTGVPAQADGGRCGMRAFFVVPAARRGGLGRWLAREVIARHPGGWEIAFQDENAGAAAFWREVAAELWGADWTETEHPVPGRPDAPADHWIRTRS